MPNSNNMVHGTLGHTYRLTVIDLVDETPHTMYVASVEDLRVVPLSQVAREIEEQINERSTLIGIQDLGAEVMVLDMRGAEESDQGGRR